MPDLDGSNNSIAMASKPEIPTKLVSMLKSRRVIPFLGAGFSAGLSLPDWDSLLKVLADELGGELDYAEVKRLCNGDHLQIAEYYLLMSDHRIGPLRHAIATALSTNHLDVLSSAPHIELVNLGAHQIYTTNYDDSIEKTFRTLRQAVEVVSLPKDVATSTGANTQVIKYHGDLRHENTLVLTESSYYARLDLESPMDLKFRSDLLGRSVLFIGYSFRDINIRVIWFKLIRMMKDISSEDRPTSFIVTFSKNPVLERLYAEVGIETICLDPDGKATDSLSRTKLLSDFMLDLSMATSSDSTIPGKPTTPQFCSSALIDRILKQINNEIPTTRLRFRFGVRGQSPTLENLLSQAAKRSIPTSLKGAIGTVLSSLVSSDIITAGGTNLALSYAKIFGSESFVTSVIARSLASEGGREILLGKNHSWETLWGGKLSRQDGERMIHLFDRELIGHKNKETEDHDLAYLADVLHRMVAGEIFDINQNEITELAKKRLGHASEVYPEISEYVPSRGEEPDVDEIIREIDARYEAFKTESSENDVPF